MRTSTANARIAVAWVKPCRIRACHSGDLARSVPPSVVAGWVYQRASLDDGLAELFRDVVEPVLRDTGAEPVVRYESIVAENNFPVLPLRDEIVLAWFAVHEDDAAYDAHRQELNRSQTWQRKVLPDLERLFVAPAQQLRLRPTARSLLGGTYTAL